MRVLVADRLSEESLDEMRALGVDVVYEPDLRADALPEALENINVLVVRGTEVSGEAVRAGTALNLIIRAGERTRHLRGHHAGQECVGRGRARVHVDRLPRSPGPGRRRQPARR
jgi:phosphoglycerate dehydrogenase-like enzyme